MHWPWARTILPPVTMRAAVLTMKLASAMLRGLDNNKDQSYFLHAVAGDKIAKTLFPVGS